MPRPPCRKPGHDEKSIHGDFDENAYRRQQRNKEKVNADTARRYAAKTGATPGWANSFFIEEAYALAQQRSGATGFSWQVDHIVPLRSKVVCGLHVESNLQVIPALVNQRKNNRHWPDMAD